MRLTPIRQLDATETLASGNKFLSAASGLVCVGEKLCVVADDEHHLVLFSRNDDAPGHLLRLLPGDLPRKKKKRKAAKPDFEILVAFPDGMICALGSGSTERRMRAALIDPGTGAVSIRDLQPLFAAIAPLVAEMNLEGAVIRGDRLLLFNRGNMADPISCILEAPLAVITGDAAPDVTLVKTLALPLIDGVPLTVTDACSLDDGRILMSAVAEVTDDSYRDGAILGCAIVMLDAALDVVAVEPVEPICKIEGISAQQTPTGVELLCVTDADDPDTPSSLYSAVLEI